jgi:hypothetical protein
MRRFGNAGLTAVLLIGLLTVSGAASADVPDTEVTDTDVTEAEVAVDIEVADTLFTFGYDMISRTFLWNLSSLEEPPECALDGLGDDCPLTGGEVSGPNGQVNHGMFLKLFNSLYEGMRRGCVVRHLAQSDLGKGDQQVKPGDEAGEPGEVGIIDFTAIATDCNHHVDEEDDDVAEGGSHGKPDHAGKPDHSGKPDSPGNSGSAPGQNK